jgi:energy-coupling factor transport system ATP-binding protein
MEKLNREQGITVLNITHNMDEAARADRVIVINDGEICYDGTPREVFSHVEGLRAVGLDVPQVTELFYELSRLGISLPEGVLDESEGADLVAALLGIRKDGAGK